MWHTGIAEIFVTRTAHEHRIPGLTKTKAGEVLTGRYGRTKSSDTEVLVTSTISHKHGFVTTQGLVSIIISG